MTEPNTAKNTAEHQMIDLTRRTRHRAEALREALEKITAERAGGAQGEHMRAIARKALEADDQAQGRLRAAPSTEHEEDE